MKKLVIAIAFIALTGSRALAADMAVKAPPPAPKPVYSWTGWYVGGNIGYGWSNAGTDFLSLGGSVSAPGIPEAAITNGPFSFADSQTERLRGAIGGGQIGYNYQLNPQWVLGVEADIQASGERGSSTSLGSFSSVVCGLIQTVPQPPSCVGNALLTGTAQMGLEAKIQWFGTVRGRVGALITDQTLVYVTGGLAYGQVRVSGSSTINANTVLLPPEPPESLTGTGTAGFGASRTNVGFSVGGGIEGRLSWLSPNWTLKLEYLYVDLGSLDSASPFPQPFTPVLPHSFLLTGSQTTHTHFTDNIVRVGVNYHFSGPTLGY